MGGITAPVPVASVPTLPEMTVARAAPESERAPASVEASVGDTEAGPEGLIEVKGNVGLFRFGKLTYRAKGLAVRTRSDLRIVLVTVAEAGEYADRLDLYSAGARRRYADDAARKLGLEPAEVEGHVARVAPAIESWQVAEQDRLERGERDEPKLTESEREEALALLRSPDLLDRVVRDLDRLGYVGEETNKKIAYLVASSRKTDRPLSGIVRSSSGAGKSRLMEVVAALMPPEEVEFFSRITPQSLYYLGKNDLKHKLLVLDERVGGEDADYSIRTLQTSRKLKLAVPQRDESSGRLRTITFEVEGPLAFMESTTASDLNPENTNRCFELYLDESQVQTKRIHGAQRESYKPEGWASDAERERLLALHRNAQRLLEPVRVAIPFVDLVRFPAEWLRTRRDHDRFLSLVAMHAFVYQHARQRATDANGFAFVTATVEDYAEAYRLAKHTLAQTLQDVPKAGRDLLDEIRDYALARSAAATIAPSDVVFTRKELRDAILWEDHKLRETLKTLAELEELETLSGRNGVRFEYRLPKQRSQARNVIAGLTTPDDLRAILAQRDLANPCADLAASAAPRAASA